MAPFPTKTGMWRDATGKLPGTRGVASSIGDERVRTDGIPAIGIPAIAAIILNVVQAAGRELANNVLEIKEAPEIVPRNANLVGQVIAGRVA